MADVAALKIVITIDGAEATVRQLGNVEGAAHRAENATRKMKGATQEFNDELLKFGRTMASFAAIFYTFQNLFGLYAVGMKFNQVIEDSRISIAGLLSSLYEYKDTTGKVIEGVDKFNIAQEDATKLQQGLRIAAITTEATYEELVFAMQNSVLPATQAGIKFEQLTGFVQRFAQIMQVVKVPMNQVNEEVRSFLQGTMQPRMTRVMPFMMGIGLTNDKIKELVASGKFAEEFFKRTLTVEIMAAEGAKTFSVALSNLKDAFSQALGEGTKKSYDALKKIFYDLTYDIVNITDDFDEAGNKIGQTLTIDPAFLNAIMAVDERLTGIIAKLKNFASTLSGLKSSHPVLSQLVVDIGDIVLSTTAWVTLLTSAVGLISWAFGKLLGVWQTLIGAFAVMEAGVVTTAGTGILGWISAIAAAPPIVKAAMVLIGAIMVDEIAAAVSSMAKTFWDWVSSFEVYGKPIKDWADDAADYVVAAFARLGVDLPAALQKAYDKIKELDDKLKEKRDQGWTLGGIAGGIASSAAAATSQLRTGITMSQIDLLQGQLTAAQQATGAAAPGSDEFEWQYDRVRLASETLAKLLLDIRDHELQLNAVVAVLEQRIAENRVAIGEALKTGQTDLANSLEDASNKAQAQINALKGGAEGFAALFPMQLSIDIMARISGLSALDALFGAGRLQDLLTGGWRGADVKLQKEVAEMKKTSTSAGMVSYDETGGAIGQGGATGAGPRKAPPEVGGRRSTVPPFEQKGKGGGGEDAEARRLQSLYDTLNKDIARLSEGRISEIAELEEKTNDQILNKKEVKEVTTDELIVLNHKRAALQRLKVEEDYAIWSGKISGDVTQEWIANAAKELQQWKGFKDVQYRVLQEYNRKVSIYNEKQIEAVATGQKEYLTALGAVTPLLSEQLKIQDLQLDKDHERKIAKLDQQRLDGDIGRQTYETLRTMEEQTNELQKQAIERKKWMTEGWQGGLKEWAFARAGEAEQRPAKAMMDLMQTAETDLSNSISGGIIGALSATKTDWIKAGQDIATAFLKKSVDTMVATLFDQLIPQILQSFGVVMPTLASAGQTAGGALAAGAAEAGATLIQAATTAQGILSGRISMGAGGLTIPGVGSSSAFSGLFKSLFGGWGMGGAPSTAGGVTIPGVGSTTVGSSLYQGWLGGNYNAKGNVFWNGEIIPFASGDIVNRKSMFQMGMMGEAGPEAIMPLSRTSSGALGVIAAGANVSQPISVVINNETGVQADADVKMDNGKLEITLSKMVSSNIARGGEIHRQIARSFNVGTKVQRR